MLLDGAALIGEAVRRHHRISQGPLYEQHCSDNRVKDGTDAADCEMLLYGAVLVDVAICCHHMVCQDTQDHDIEQPKRNLTVCRCYFGHETDHHDRVLY